MEHSRSLARFVKEREVNVGASCEPTPECSERVYFLLASAFICFENVDTGTLYFFSSAMIVPFLCQSFTTSDMKAMNLSSPLSTAKPHGCTSIEGRGRSKPPLQAGSSESGLLNESS